MTGTGMLALEFAALIIASLHCADTGRQATLVPCGLVAVDDLLAHERVDDRDGLAVAAQMMQCSPMMQLWPIWTRLSIFVPLPMRVVPKRARSMALFEPISTGFWIQIDIDTVHSIKQQYVP